MIIHIAGPKYGYLPDRYTNIGPNENILLFNEDIAQWCYENNIQGYSIYYDGYYEFDSDLDGNNDNDFFVRVDFKTEADLALFYLRWFS